MFDRPEPRPPPAELIRGLAVLAEPPTEEHPGIVEALGLGDVPSSADYSDLFLFQLYPYASVHLGPEGMMGGEARGRVAGFWRALGYDPPTEPDHLSALLGLYATLAEAGHAGAHAQAERRLVRESRFALLREHLEPWVFAFLARVRELTKGTYAAWAAQLESVLREELAESLIREQPASDSREESAAADVEAHALPLHLRLAPPLPDPREVGAGDFVSGLLAPVRSGVLLVRADVAAIASACDVGLRAGERRYALEHLLAQDGVAVLRALAEEARRQATLHESRTEWLGGVADFLAGRARTTATLLDVLAAEETAREGVGS